MVIFLPWLCLLPMAALAAFWLGEDLHRPRLPSFAGLCLVLACAGGIPAQRIGTQPLVLTVTISVFVVIASYLIGGVLARGAFYECENNGDDVRRLLADFHRENGRYPDDLSVLPMSRMPGERLLRDSVLRYGRTEAGYLLSYSDWAAEHRATEIGHWETLESH